MTATPALFPLPDSDAPQGLTGRDLLRQWFKHWLVIVVCVVTVSVLTWAGLSVQPKQYDSSAKIWVQTEQQGTPSFLSGIAAYRESQIPDPVNRKIETEMQLLLSRSNAESVVDALGITKEQLIQSPVSYVKAALHIKSDKSARVDRDEIVELFMKAVTVEPTRSKTADTTSNVLEVHFACADRQLAPRALAALLQQYMQFGVQHNKELGESTYRSVQAKMDEQGKELHKLDQEILQLTQEQAERVDVDSPTGAPGVNSNTALVAGSEGLRMDTVLSSARTAGPSSLGLMKSQTLEMQAKLDEMRQLYTDKSPNVRSLSRQLGAMKSRLTSGVKASATLDARLGQLDRERAMALDRFAELRKKLDQIELYLQLNPVESDSRVITEQPLLPEKPQTKIKIVLAILGPLAGFFLGLMLAGLKEYFDHRLQDARDVQAYLGLPTLGVVPRLHERALSLQSLRMTPAGLP